MGTVAAQDYRAEIMAEVIDPCHEQLLQEMLRERGQDGVAGYSNSELLERIKSAIPQSANDRIINAVQGLVEGHNRESRTLLYRFSLIQCVDSAKEGIAGG